MPQDRIAEVPPEVGVPIAEKLAYVTDDQLSGLYINLLAKASTLDYAHTAHPSFVNVISNLSPDEALLLQHIREDRPFVEAGFRRKARPSGIHSGCYVTGLEVKTKLSYPQISSRTSATLRGLALST